MSDNRRELGPDDIIQAGDYVEHVWSSGEVDVFSLNAPVDYTGLPVTSWTRCCLRCKVYRPAPPSAPEPPATEAGLQALAYEQLKTHLMNCEAALAERDQSVSDWRGLCCEMEKALKAADAELATVGCNPMLPPRVLILGARIKFEKMTGKKP